MAEQSIKIKEHEDGITIECRVTPRAKRSRIKGVREGAIEIALNAPPVDGKANEALIEFLSEILSVPKSKLTIEKGLTSRLKTVSARGCSKDDIEVQLAKTVNNTIK